MPLSITLSFMSMLETMLCERTSKFLIHPSAQQKNMQPASAKDTYSYVTSAAGMRILTSILLISIASVAAAAVAAFAQSVIYILQTQTFTIDYRRVVGNSSNPFEVFESVLTPQSHHLFSGESHEDNHVNLVFVFDLWERMVNIQSGLRRLVNIGVESRFTVVEPFMYESRIQLSYSDPLQFVEESMIPQPAMHYFQTEDLFFTNHYISYEEGVKKMQRVDHGNGMPAYVIHAAVFFDWPDERRHEKDFRSAKEDSSSFRWCNERLQAMTASSQGYMISKTIFVERAVCLSINDTMSPSVLTPQYFHSLFDFIRSGKTNINRRCKQCVAIAFMNYRKHTFNGFQSSLGIQPFKQKVPPLEVSAFGRELAERVRTEILQKRPYVAVQLRTGKAFTLFKNQEQMLLRDGIRIERNSLFKYWLQNCSKTLSSAAKRKGLELGRRTVYYIASDMFNDGWKGGETCPAEVKKVLDDVKLYLSRELHPLRSFDPRMLGIKQDVMGTSSIADAAVSREADRFLFAMPSNFGKWIAEQRELAGKGKVLRVSCLDERLQS